MPARTKNRRRGRPAIPREIQRQRLLKAATRAFAAALADDEGLVRLMAVDHALASSAEELVELVSPLLLDPLRAVRMQAAVVLADAPDTLLKPYQLEARAEALAEYERAMSHSLDFAFAGHNLGNLYARTGDAG